MILFVCIAVCLLSVRLANRYKENLFDNMDDKQKEEKIRDLEDYIFKRLYRKLFPFLLSEEDLLVSQR